MKAVTWQKDSHGLFDYETKSLSVKKYRVDGFCKIYRDGQEIVLLEGKTKEEPNLNYLTQVQNQNQDYFINPETRDDNYLIVRSLKNSEGVQKGYQLQPGDVLKLGRIDYAVIEIRDSRGNIFSIKDLFCSDEQLVQKVDLTNDPQKVCKICLFEDQTEANPLISPCKCKGSCEFVHFECLKSWIENRGQKKQNGNTVIFKWKKLDCEICQEPLPKRISIEGKFYDLADLERPLTPYIILESVAKEKKVSKGLYLIKSPFDEPIKMGRGHQCDIRISDISVSRLHAFIKYENGQFVIIDNNSKFGTLVKLAKPFQIQSDKIAIQQFIKIGRTVLTFVLKSFTGGPYDFSKIPTNKTRLSEPSTKPFSMTQSLGPKHK